MLPILVYNNMEGSSNLNNSVGSSSSFSHLYDENVIINSVRNRKKVSELPSCPVCSCTIRHGELESHLSLEVERLQKLSSGGSKRKLSVSSGAPPAVPGSSTGTEAPDDQEIDVTGCPGSDVYQRVHSSRLRRLRARRRSPPPPPPAQGECPVCNTMLPTYKLQKHALRCLKRTGADMDDSSLGSSSDDDIDVENDEPSGGRFGAEYEWCGQWRVRAAALQAAGETRAALPVRRASSDHALVVDGDEDTELYGPAQYSPSRIAPDADIPESSQPEPTEQRVETNGQTDEATDREPLEMEQQDVAPKPNGLVEASAETRIQALKEKIRELEKRQNSASEAKCLICLGPHVSPAVSIQCWHVYCEVCWLQSLKAKKICPQCNAITTSQHLRRIYM